MTKYFAIPVFALALAGCANVTDLLGTGRPYAAETAKELALASCALPMAERIKNAQAVRDKLAAEGSAINFMLDCDGDGSPDFAPQ